MSEEKIRIVLQARKILLILSDSSVIRGSIFYLEVKVRFVVNLVLISIVARISVLQLNLFLPHNPVPAVDLTGQSLGKNPTPGP